MMHVKESFLFLFVTLLLSTARLSSGNVQPRGYVETMPKTTTTSALSEPVTITTTTTTTGYGRPTMGYRPQPLDHGYVPTGTGTATPIPVSASTPSGVNDVSGESEATSESSVGVAVTAGASAGAASAQNPIALSGGGDPNSVTDNDIGGGTNSGMGNNHVVSGLDSIINTDDDPNAPLKSNSAMLKIMMALVNAALCITVFFI